MDNRTRKILLVEDDRLLRKAAHAALRQRGYDVVAITDGAEALQAARMEPPDLILLDLVMPRANGHEVLRALKADTHMASIPIIILTNLGQESDKQAAAEAGATDYIIKSSLSLEDLTRRVDEVLAAEELRQSKPASSV